jgi:alanyl-tRNA synthetase
MSEIERHFKPTSRAIENIFLDYFRAQKYAIVPGSSLLDDSVPMSFVMSAGLVQVERAALQAGSPRQGCFALVQNCFRHFDLERVGEDDLHLSFFRMAGAFTFGPIQRRERIGQIWALLTQNYGLAPEELWITYFRGDVIAGYPFPSDTETYQSWLEVGVFPEHLVALGGESNFWKQSAQVVGAEHAPKCGPNTEVFFDRGVNKSCGVDCLPGCACGRFVEFTNTLFITWGLNEVNSEPIPLAEPFTETVIGVERLAIPLQSVNSVFETNLLNPLLEEVRSFSEATALTRAELTRQECRLVDHLRALLFLVADGAPAPFKKGARSFLIRKLIRGTLTSIKLLEIFSKNFLPEILEQITALHHDLHPGLCNAQTTLIEYIHAESEKFEYTLQAATRQLESILSARQEPRWVGGNEMLALEKQYGMPLDLLISLLDQRQAYYDWREYNLARQHWLDEMTPTLS